MPVLLFFVFMIVDFMTMVWMVSEVGFLGAVLYRVALFFLAVASYGFIMRKFALKSMEMARDMMRDPFSVQAIDALWPLRAYIIAGCLIFPGLITDVIGLVILVMTVVGIDGGKIIGKMFGHDPKAGPNAGSGGAAGADPFGMGGGATYRRTSATDDDIIIDAEYTEIIQDSNISNQTKPANGSGATVDGDAAEKPADGDGTRDGSEESPKSQNPNS